MKELITFGLWTIAIASQKIDPAVEAEVQGRVAEVQGWAADPTIVAAVLEADGNLRSMDEIEEIDRDWQAATGVTDFMRTLINHPASERLRELRSSDPALQEIFATDQLGALVAATNKTSDFYQGDEEKFHEAFAEGKGGIHIGKLALDESIQSYSIPIGVPVLDQGKAIGVLVATLNVQKLKRKRGR
ncbi:MAG: PDC sensor domain-containing protein [Vicinamibacteria bacterium]